MATGNKVIIRGSIGDISGVGMTSEEDDLELNAIYLISGSNRGENEEHQVAFDNNQVAEFQFSDGVVWFSDYGSIENVFPGIKSSKRAATDAIEIPNRLTFDGEQRDIKDIFLKVVKIFTRKRVIDKTIKELAAILEQKQLDNKVGLFQLSASFDLSDNILQEDGKPYLLFIHGTNSSTKGSFELLQGSSTWSHIQQVYEKRVLAFQHETLTKNPFDNVNDLIDQLPTNGSFHLITHSRGGLVGDLFCRICADPIEGGFSNEELQYWENKAPDSGFKKSLEAIKLKLKGKNLRVTKYIRVACPASGTTLASNRMDFLFNISFNLIGLATGNIANPVYIAFRNLIAAIIKEKDNPKVLGGIEAMNPDSPFIKVLNYAKPKIYLDTPLYVISGNSQVNFRWKSLLVLASKLFFTAKNDFVVNTDAMVNGAWRKEGLVHLYFDQGGEVDHFHYFGNSKTQEAILLALKHEGSALIPGFENSKRTYDVEELRNAILGIEGGRLFSETPSGKRPIVVLLPGIMGSNITVENKQKWINYFSFATGGLRELEYTTDTDKRFEASSLIGTAYHKLARNLQKNYDVVAFPFDWRVTIEYSADLLHSKLKDLLKYKQPVKIIAHSMGGLVMREILINKIYKNTLDQLKEKEGFRMVFLGTPFGGSFRIINVLFGQDGIIKKLGRLDLTNDTAELINIFKEFPGLLGLLPISEVNGKGFESKESWQEMVKYYSGEVKPIPSVDKLKGFAKYRTSILNSKVDFDRAVYIAGIDKATPLGYKIEDGKLIFLSTSEGDQSVTWATGIPKELIENGNVYYANATHGALANDEGLFKPISEILETGKTKILSKIQPQTRGGEKVFTAPNIDDFDYSQKGVENTILGLGESNAVPLVEFKSLKVQVSNGDLLYARYPILAGHFLNDGLFSVEKALDWHLKGELRRRMQLGFYPGEIGTYELILVSEDPENNFPGAIIAGLGQQGRLNAFLLCQTVEQAIARYLARFNSPMEQKRVDVSDLGISCPAIGCGYGGLSIEASLRAIIQGIQNANQKIIGVYGKQANTISLIEFTELFEDKSLNYVYVLNLLEKDRNNRLHFDFPEKKIFRKPGGRKRLPFDDTSDWWTRIEVTLDIERCNDKQTTKGFRYKISTDAARQEERSILIDFATIKSLLDELSTKNNWSEELAKTLFELLIPNDFKEQLKKQNNIIWIVNKETALFPWELLQDRLAESRPLSINSGMIRQLATQDYRTIVNPVMSKTALVIADPDLKDAFKQLVEASREGTRISEIIERNSFTTKTLINKGPGEILVSLLSKEYKIVHFAGHGIFNEDSDKPSGMLIGPNAFLTPAMINQMSSVPDLVFVNCCYGGASNSDSEKLMQSRHRLAANIGTQLIDIGVKAVVVAGWAIQDRTALEFAEEFYNQMFSGENFGLAILKAREKAFDYSGNSNNTWGAYQCYGDPFYTLDGQSKFGTTSEKGFVVEREAEIELYNLYSRQDTGQYSMEFINEQLNLIIKKVNEAGLRTPAITEWEAKLYYSLNKYSDAIDKYASLRKGENSQFSLAALEQYCNLRAKYFVREWRNGNMVKEFGKEFQKIIEDVENLMKISETAERLSILGSTYKRMALVQETNKKLKTYQAAASSYCKASMLASPGKRYYPLTNWLMLHSMLVFSGASTWDVKAERYEIPSKKEALRMLKEELEFISKSISYDETFWNMIAVPDIVFTQYVLGGEKIDFEFVLQSYKKVWNKAGSSGEKESVLEQFEFLLDVLNYASKNKQGTRGRTKIKTEIEKLKRSLEGK